MAEEKKPTPAKATAKPAKKKGGLGRWFHDMKGEMKKIVWPTKQMTVKNTGIVLGMCLCVGVFLWVFDAVAGTIITTLLTAFN